MNILTIIQDTILSLGVDAEVFLLEERRADNEELEHTGDTIVILPDWKTETKLNQGLELFKTRVYNIHFKTLDEWDNSDAISEKSYNDESSIERIERMEILADSIFSHITANNGSYPEIREKLKWRATEPILRANNGTMSGVVIQLTITFNGERVCQ